MAGAGMTATAFWTDVVGPAAVVDAPGAAVVEEAFAETFVFFFDDPLDTT